VADTAGPPEQQHEQQHEHKQRQQHEHEQQQQQQQQQHEQRQQPDQEQQQQPNKKVNQPFQRVPADSIPIDPKFASNAYVPYDYAERAHQDLAPTKGKRFTKEKNKKKRGSYRGGTIDVYSRKGIKFE
jgi:signal recognition particle GTPase